MSPAISAAVDVASAILTAVAIVGFIGMVAVVASIAMGA